MSFVTVQGSLYPPLKPRFKLLIESVVCLFIIDSALFQKMHEPFIMQGSKVLGWNIMDDLDRKKTILANDLVFELNKSLGFKKDGFAQSLLKPLVWTPMVRFSELATIFEHRIVQ